MTDIMMNDIMMIPHKPSTQWRVALFGSHTSITRPNAFSYIPLSGPHEPVWSIAVLGVLTIVASNCSNSSGWCLCFLLSVPESTKLFWLVTVCSPEHAAIHQIPLAGVFVFP
jgi:hypothetical protein